MEEEVEAAESAVAALRPEPIYRRSARAFVAAGAVALCVGFLTSSLDAAGVKGLPLAYAYLAALWVVGVVATFAAESIWVLRPRLRLGIFLGSSGALAALCIAVGFLETAHDRPVSTPGNSPASADAKAKPPDGMKSVDRAEASTDVRPWGNQQGRTSALQKSSSATASPLPYEKRVDTAPVALSPSQPVGPASPAIDLSRVAREIVTDVRMTQIDGQDRESGFWMMAVINNVGPAPGYSPMAYVLPVITDKPLNDIEIQNIQSSIYDTIYSVPPNKDMALEVNTPIGRIRKDIAISRDDYIKARNGEKNLYSFVVISFRDDVIRSDTFWISKYVGKMNIVTYHFDDVYRHTDLVPASAGQPNAPVGVR